MLIISNHAFEGAVAVLKRVITFCISISSCLSVYSGSVCVYLDDDELRAVLSNSERTSSYVLSPPPYLENNEVFCSIQLVAWGSDDPSLEFITRSNTRALMWYLDAHTLSVDELIPLLEFELDCCACLINGEIRISYCNGRVAGTYALSPESFGAAEPLSLCQLVQQTPDGSIRLYLVNAGVSEFLLRVYDSGSCEVEPYFCDSFRAE